MSDLFKFPSKPANDFIQPDRYGLNQKRKQPLNDKLSGQFEQAVQKGVSSQASKFQEALKATQAEPAGIGQKITPDMSVYLQEMSQEIYSQAVDDVLSSKGDSYMRQAYHAAQRLQETTQIDDTPLPTLSEIDFQI